MDIKKKEDEDIFMNAIMDKSLSESYSSDRLKLANAIIMVGALNKVDMAEIYCPERTTKLCKEYGLSPGVAMDLKNGYDSDCAADRNRVREMLDEDEPLLMVGSPPCTCFSMLQELNKHSHRDDIDWQIQFKLNVEKALRHVLFCIDIYNYQRAHGRLFLHAHPWMASSWTF